MSRPFLCPNCRNYYTDVPTQGTCPVCAADKHARNKAGIFDCHFGQLSSTPEEVRMLQLLETIRGASAAARKPLGTEQDKVTAALKEVEASFSLAERAYGEMPNILQWAGVFEMPGMQGEDDEARFKDLRALQTIVGMGRRPPSDLQMIQRSVQVCNEMSTEATALMADARIAVGRFRQAAMNWTAPSQEAPVPHTRTPAQLAYTERMKKAAAERREAVPA